MCEREGWRKIEREKGKKQREREREGRKEMERATSPCNVHSATDEVSLRVHVHKDDILGNLQHYSRISGQEIQGRELEMEEQGTCGPPI